ncbi:MAG: DDE-type integrase/transposase/recombinase [Anaerolineae bacterium]|nr:DDE-type integrase/transposase/recombinase [Anaerolineae bacterium]
MDSESQWIYDRMTLYTLSQQHPTWKATQLGAAMGRSERWVRKWLKRFAAVEAPHFKMFVSQSRAPKTRPQQTSDGVKDVICDLRVSLSETYHRPAGARLIQQYLKEHEFLQNSQEFIPRSTRTITKILSERGYIQRPKPRDHQPLALCEPMEEWEMDFCEIHLPDGHFEFFLVVDRGTSRVVHLEGCEGYRADTALIAVTRLFLLNGLPKRLRFDRDPRLVWSWSADSFPAPLIRLLHVLGVEPVICPPRRPDKKPYVERCIRTFKHEWLGRFSLNSMADVYEALEAFPHYHNAQRRHLGRACGGRTPDAAFPQLPTLPALPDTVEPNRWLAVEHGRVFRRRIRADGSIQASASTHSGSRLWSLCYPSSSC